MIAEGSFPYPARGADSTAAPRVGDGVMSLDADGPGPYLSPNANSALHRVGIHANAVGMTLAELGFHDDMVRKAYEHRIPVVEEFEPASDVALLCRCLPILAGGEVAGGVLLVRDVTDLRKRDRLLISKDATIREIHHRVKNNLQTISSLLRLQARRLENPEAKAAVSESVRRIRTIALVHESLSASPATTSRSSRSCGRCCASPRRACSRRTGRCTSSWPATAGASRRASPRRCRSCSPS